MKKRKIIFVICYLAYTSIYIARLNLSMASPGLIEKGILSTQQFGILGSIFSVIYAFGRFINGFLSDRKPPWFMISLGLVIAGISNIAVGFFPPLIGILLLWGCNAYAQSMLWSSVLCVISSIYDEATAKKKTSYIVTSVAAGNIIGIILSTVIITRLGLKYAFILPGGLTLIFSTLIILTVHDIKIPKATDSHMEIKKIFSDSDVRTVIIPAMLHGVIKDNISLWMTVYFVDKFSINLNQSAYFVLFIPAVGFIGRMLYPVCYRLCRERENTVSQYAFIVSILASTYLCFGAGSPIGAVVCLSVTYAAVSIINTSILSIFPMHYISSGNVASISGIMDFATYFGAGAGAFIYGFLIKAFGYGAMYLSWAIISLISFYILKKRLRN